MTPAEEKEYKAAWYQANKARIAEKRRTPEGRARVAAHKAKYYAENTEKCRAYTREWAAKNYGRKLEADRKYAVENVEKARAKTKAWRDANPEWKKANDKAWQQNNPLKVKLIKARRRSRVRTATPPWVDKRSLDAVYITAECYGLHVDHIIPLKHPLVSGLHVPANLQLLPRSDNARKGNKFSPENYHG